MQFATIKNKNCDIFPKEAILNYSQQFQLVHMYMTVAVNNLIFQFGKYWQCYFSSYIQYIFHYRNFNPFLAHIAEDESKFRIELSFFISMTEKLVQNAKIGFKVFKTTT